MKIKVHNKCSDFTSYRAARVKSLFNAESGCNFDLIADIDIEDSWNIGVVVGPSGSGKTSIGKLIFKENLIHNYEEGWPADKPIIDCIIPDGSFDNVTGALAAVGLGDVPSWLRPFHVLSNGEKFRAGLARIICEKPEQVVIDEFTSVVDRQIAKIGAQAFQKSWRRSNPNGKCVLLTPHYDVLDWLEPDWVFDTKSKNFERGRLRRRPKFELEIRKTDYSYWKYFKPHYYLDLPIPPAAEAFVGTVDGELVSHVMVSPLFTAHAYRATRLVVMPEWQGAGVGTTFLNWIAQYHLEGFGRCFKKYSTFFHTSHPQLCGYLRRSPLWIHKKASLYGDNKLSSIKSILRTGKGNIRGAGYGGHFRAVQSFKYIGNQTKTSTRGEN